MLSTSTERAQGRFTTAGPQAPPRLAWLFLTALGACSAEYGGDQPGSAAAASSLDQGAAALPEEAGVPDAAASHHGDRGRRRRFVGVDGEPRAIDQVDSYLEWIATSASFIRALDRNHLITIGSEGDTSAPDTSGNDYLRDHSIENIDYGTAHVWVQNWGWYDPLRAEETYDPAVALAGAYIDSHVERTLELDKPIVFEEFGLARDQNSFDPTSTVEWRDRYYNQIFGHLLDRAGENAVAGANFWAWAGEGRPLAPFGLWWEPGDPFIGDPPHEQQGWYSVYDTDESTSAIIARYADLMSGLDRHE